MCRGEFGGKITNNGLATSNFLLGIGVADVLKLNHQKRR
jgi:hypothetical protein